MAFSPDLENAPRERFPFDFKTTAAQQFSVPHDQLEQVKIEELKTLRQKPVFHSNSCLEPVSPLVRRVF